MTKHNAKDYLPLVQALAEGKTIQSNYRGTHWVDLDDVSFSDPHKCYRIKPEPRRWWLVWDGPEQYRPIAFTTCPVKGNAETVIIEVVEVIK